jgi:hypothetical protein
MAIALHMARNFGMSRIFTNIPYLCHCLILKTQDEFEPFSRSTLPEDHALDPSSLKLLVAVRKCQRQLTLKNRFSVAYLSESQLIFMLSWQITNVGCPRN